LVEGETFMFSLLYSFNIDQNLVTSLHSFFVSLDY